MADVVPALEEHGVRVVGALGCMMLLAGVRLGSALVVAGIPNTIPHLSSISFCLPDPVDNVTPARTPSHPFSSDSDSD